MSEKEPCSDLVFRGGGGKELIAKTLRVFSKRSASAYVPRRPIEQIKGQHEIQFSRLRRKRPAIFRPFSGARFPIRVTPHKGIRLLLKVNGYF